MKSAVRAHAHTHTNTKKAYVEEETEHIVITAARIISEIENTILNPIQ